MPESALQNWKKVVVRLVCFCLPCGEKRAGQNPAEPISRVGLGQELTWMAMTGRSM